MDSDRADAPDPFKLCGVTIENKYRIASVVGDGGFGVVYRAVHKGFGELIAVKCLKVPGELDEKERDALLEQLRDEGRLLHRLSKVTSGIVQALDVGAFTTEAGAWVPYLVLEWLEGETLGEFIKNRRDSGAPAMSVEEAMHFLEPAARALGVAHAQNVAHRDVKPANLFVTTVGGARTVKVLDFGIAKVLAEHASFTAALEATKMGPTAFTPRYGAPEQFNKNRGATGPWTDVFALALILVELVTGKKALEGDDPTQLYIASADPSLRPTLRARGYDCPDVIEAVVDKALSVEPKQRYVNATEFWRALSAACARVSSSKIAVAPQAATPAPTEAYLDAMKLKLDEPTSPKIDATRPVESLIAGVASLRSSAPDSSLPSEPRPISKSRDRTSSDPAGRTRESSVAPRATPAPGVTPSPKVTPAPGKRVLPAEDPMAETPLPGKVSAPSRAIAAAPPASAVKTSGSILPWLGAVVVLGGGAAVWMALGDTPSSHHDKSVAPAAAKSARPAISASGPHLVPLAPSPNGGVASAVDAGSTASVPFTPPETMAFIAPATFTMGEGVAAKQVTLTRGFYLDRNEVTVHDYEECMEKRACSNADHVSFTAETAPDAAVTENASLAEYAATWGSRCNLVRKAETDPINCVDFANAAGYCRFRGRRLPTEAEWELAARSPKARPFVWGDGAADCEAACYDRNGGCLGHGAAVSTCVAGSHARDKTPEGIADLGGNVSEWVSDGFMSPLPGGSDPVGDPASPLRVLRGASFLDEADKLRASWRAAASPVTAHVTIGFRCALDAPPENGAR